MSKKALITGITGQDGRVIWSNCIESKGYEVHGIIRRLRVPLTPSASIICTRIRMCMA